MKLGGNIILKIKQLNSAKYSKRYIKTLNYVYTERERERERENNCILKQLNLVIRENA